MTVTIHTKGDYQDIREQLRKRIELLERMQATTQKDFAAKQEKALADHKDAMENFKTTIANYRNMLNLEESFATSILEVRGPVKDEPACAEVALTIPKAKLPLADFLIAQIGERSAMTKEDLRMAAVFANYFSQGDSGARSIHATLINLVRNKSVFADDEGLYRLTSPSGVSSQAEFEGLRRL